MNLIAQLGLSCLDYQATYTLYYSYWHNIGITHAIPKNIQVTEMIKKTKIFTTSVSAESKKYLVKYC